LMAVAASFAHRAAVFGVDALHGGLC